MKWAAKLAVDKMLAPGPDGLYTFTSIASAERSLEVTEAAVMAHVTSRDDSGDVGTAAHDLLELYVNAWIASGERPTQLVIPTGTDARAIAAMRAGIAYLASRPEVVPIATEVAVGYVEGKLAVAGKLDLVLWNQKTAVLEILDWKSSSRIEPFYAAQIAAYAWALEKMAGIRVRGNLIVVKLDKYSDRFEVHKVRDRKAATDLYRACDAICQLTEETDQFAPSKVAVVI